MKKRVMHYKPNVVYGLLLEQKNYYVGCHTISSGFIRGERPIILDSANYLARKLREGEISKQNYLANCELLFIEEFDSKEEALDREVELIAECKENHGEFCANKSLGNKIGCKGIQLTEETRNKMSESRKRLARESEDYIQKLRNSLRGIPKNEETRRKISETLKRRNLSEEFRKRNSDSHKGQHKGEHWYTNGLINMRALSCPEGFWKGITKLA